MVRLATTTAATALILFLHAAPLLAATPAATLADICPGTPDPCVVSGQFSVVPGSVFDAAGRAVHLLDGAQLIGNGVAPFSLINAASIDLDPGSLLQTSPQRSPYYFLCPLDDGYTYAPAEPLAAFNGQDPNGTWTLRVTNPSVATGNLDTWGLEICTENGCSTVASTDVPLALPFGSPHDSDVPVVATGSVTRVSAVNLTGHFTSIGVLYFDLLSPQGTLVRLAANACERGPYSPTFDMNFADPVGLFADVHLQSTGACALGGEISLDDPTGGVGGTLNADCQSVTLGAGAELHSNGGNGGRLTFNGGSCAVNRARLVANGGLGTPHGKSGGGDIILSCDEVRLNDGARLDANAPAVSELYPFGGLIHLDCGAPGCFIAGSARITAKGSFESLGGKLLVTGTGLCEIGGHVDVTAKPLVVFEEEGGGLFFRDGGGGWLEANCGSIVVPAHAKITVSKSPYGFGGQIKLTAATTVQIDAGAYLRADGSGSFGRTLDVTAGDRCTVDGRISAQARWNSGGPFSFQCKGFTVGPKGQVTASSSAAVAAEIDVDTTGATSGQPPADCTIAGKVRSVSRSVSEQGTGNAGEIHLDCGTTATVERTGKVDTSCSGFEGEAGYVYIVAGGDVSIDGKVGGGGSFRGAAISVDACSVDVTARGSLSSGGWGGPVTLTARDTLTIDGAVRGGPNGSVALNFRDAISLAGSIAPPPLVTQNPLLLPCP